MTYKEVAMIMTDVCKFIFCTEYDKFANLYKEYGISDSNSYIGEKWQVAQKNFTNWWCNLDAGFQTFVIEKVIDYYK